jgi:glucan biosynthesis protein C
MSRTDQKAPRLAFIDNLRIAAITMVVVHHAAQAYASVGIGWAIVNSTQAPVLRPFLAVNGAFGMQLMFLLAGYFTPYAYDRHGARELLHKRLVRLGGPTLIVSLGVFLPYTYLTQPVGTPFFAFLRTYLPQPQVGHMWFASLLLACSLGYAVWRAVRGSERPPAAEPGKPPGHIAIFSFALWLGAITIPVRLAYPLNRWVSPLPFLWFDPVHLPQYLSLFALGCAAARRDWLCGLPKRTGEIWLGIGLGAAALLYATITLGERLSGALVLAPRAELGLNAICWTGIETLVCVGLCVGLPTLFRERLNRQIPLLRQFSAVSYAVYVTHLLPVLGLQLVLAELPLPPLVKFLLVAAMAAPLSFGLAVVLRKLPVFASILE